MARIAHDKDKIIGFSFSSVLNSDKKSKIMGRMMQNIRLCRKYKVKTYLGSFAHSPSELRARHDLKAFFICLGMHASEAKESLDILK